MFPLYLNKNKIIIFWSYKCGCTFIKTLFYNTILNKKYSINYIKLISFMSTFYFLNLNKIQMYKKILICRNPYSRIVSCFIDKYINGRFTKYMNYNIFLNKINNIFFRNKKNINFTFENFINILYEITQHNFSYYILEKKHIMLQFDKNIKIDKIYKLENFDEKKFLNNEFNIKIYNKINNDFGNNTNCSICKNTINNVYEMNYEQLLKLKNDNKIPNFRCFYNNEIKIKIDIIYKNDLIFLKKYGIDYVI